MFDSILVPTDGSDPAERATEVALDLARRDDATVHALYVLDTGREMAHFDPVVERLERDGERAVDAVADAAEAAGLEAVRRFRKGRPHREILGYVDDREVDLVVMGSHGRSGVDRFVNAGSVTERVVRYAERPVLVV